MEVKQAQSQAEFFGLMHVRTNVFIIEQQVDPAIELDEYDASALHLVAVENDHVIGTLRILEGDGYYKIGRVAISKAYRSRGIGTRLMEAAHTYIPKGARVRLGAQCTAIPFYEKLGYQPFGEVFLDADIEHIMMEKCL